MFIYTPSHNTNIGLYTLSRAQANRSADKRYLAEITDVMNASRRRIKLDECGDWNIVGRFGKIFTDSKEWFLYLPETSERKWNNLKKRLKFMKVSQDGDEEGILKLDRLPTKREAEVIRKTMKIKKPSISENLHQISTQEG